MRCPAPITPSFSSRRRSYLRGLLPSASSSNPAVAYIATRILPLGDRPEDDDMDPETLGDPQAIYLGDQFKPRQRRVNVKVVVACLICSSYIVLAYIRPYLFARSDNNFDNSATPLSPTLSDEVQMPYAVTPGEEDTQILFKQPLHEPQHLLQPLTTRPPFDILSPYYSSGIIPDNAQLTPTPQVDVVLLWVNASGEFVQKEMIRRAEEEGLRIYIEDGSRYRDNGELKGAIRSSVASLGHQLDKVHVITGDYTAPRIPTSGEIGGNLQDSRVDKEEQGNEWRVGQIPNWLDWSTVEKGTTPVRWHFHSQIFQLPADEDEIQGNWAEGAWREASLPSFNSFAIESRVGWTKGLSQNFIFANDDMFMLKPLSATDFHHPLLGDVIRPDGNLVVKPQVTSDLYSSPGEWGGLQYAAQLISQRFPFKSRGYLYHIPKATTLHIMHEANIMWERELTDAATRGFRRSQRGLADVEIIWLATYLRVERWREALLWSWAVARLGGESGLWEAEARVELRRVLGIDYLEADELGDEILVKRGPRETLPRINEIDRRMGWDAPRGTQYIFSSMDGILPRYAGTSEGSSCIFSISSCLPPGFFQRPTDNYVASEMFVWLAFQRPSCGDCLITALISASGPLGLSSILPEESQIVRPERRHREKWERNEPILPLTNTWDKANFGLKDVVKRGQDHWEGSPQENEEEVNLRQWCIKLLSRYAYVVGSTNHRFTLVHNLAELKHSLHSFDADRSIAMACVNDDQPADAPDGTQETFNAWMNERWGDVDATWERDGMM